MTALRYFLLSFVITLQLFAAAGDEPPRHLSPRGAKNLDAFTRLLGYVRFYHPSDQSAAADWNSVAMAGVQTMESADDTADLVQKLDAFFRPLAPTLRVYPTGQRPPVPDELQPRPNPVVMYWGHIGVGLPGGPGYFFSDRYTYPGTHVAGSPLPAPYEPLEVSLGDGISALLPITVFTEAGVTVPHSTAPAPAPVKPAGFVPSGNDRVTRLAGIVLAWPVFTHFYPYFDQVQVDWSAELPKALNAAADDPNERAFVDTLRRLVAALDDGHARVAHASWPRGYQLPIVWTWIDNKLVVTHAGPGTTLAAGDIILTIDNRPAKQVCDEELALAPGATPQHLRSRALDSMLLGGQSSEVHFRVLRHHGGVDEVTVRRTLPNAGNSAQTFLTEPRPEKISTIRPGIVYVDIARITYDEFYAAMDQLIPAEGIIFDFRGYPWDLDPWFLEHLTDQPMRTDLFEDPLFWLPEQQQVEYFDGGWFVGVSAPRLTSNVAFITDGRAVSYAESLMGIVEHDHVGEIVGEATAGTNGNVNFMQLPGNYVLRFTGLRVRKQDGSPHHGVGILPTVPAVRTMEGIRAGRDEFLEKAIEVIESKR
ncbi:MAG TPA: S41 family peptidase [Thermoanaerobaculia bacterium]|nr:S41 family peptidase [Thermoanaerobaculia bacterium]